MPDSFSLAELGAKFYRITTPGKLYTPVKTLEEAQGLQFVCPKCYLANGGPVGSHRVICWFMDRGVSDDESPKPGRWNPAGTGLSDLTFVGPRSCSVQLNGGCNWHGFVRGGRATLS